METWNCLKVAVTKVNKLTDGVVYSPCHKSIMSCII